MDGRMVAVFFTGVHLDVQWRISQLGGTEAVGCIILGCFRVLRG
jgi:hypothetical protein